MKKIGNGATEYSELALLDQFKGPFFFWKECSTVNLERFRGKVAPLTTSWNRKNPHLVLMQDGAPSRSVFRATSEMKRKDI